MEDSQIENLVDLQRRAGNLDESRTNCQVFRGPGLSTF